MVGSQLLESQLPATPSCSTRGQSSSLRGFSSRRRIPPVSAKIPDEILQLHTRKSGIIYGIEEDAQHIAQVIVQRASAARPVTT